MKSFKTLIKREFWEHRGAIFSTPLVLAAVFAAFMILGVFTTGNIVNDHGNSFSLTQGLPQMMQKFEQESEAARATGVQAFLYGQGVFFIFVMMIISLRYCLNCLYEERKDRSILFWKSLPLSDTSTVLSKVFSIMVLTPMIYGAVIIVFQLFVLIFGTILAWFGESSGASIWAASAFHKVMFNTLASTIVLSIWFAPFWGWLMLASAWAKRAPFLWASLPVVAIFIGEGWIFNSASFAEMIGHYIRTGVEVAGSNVATLFQNSEEFGPQNVDLAVSHPLQAFGLSQFWIGMVVAAVFVTAAIYIRRYRDES